MNKYPLIRFTILFIIGIIFQFCCHVEIKLLFYILIFLIFLLVLSIYVKRINQFQIIHTVIILILSFFFGAAAYQSRNNEKVIEPFDKEYVKNVTVYGKIENIELLRKSEFDFSLTADSLYTDSLIIKGKFLLNCRVRDTSINTLKKKYQSLKPGNYLCLNAYYIRGREIRNPGETDYRKMLLMKGISGYLTVYSASKLQIRDSSNSFYKAAVFNLRKAIADKISVLHNDEASGLLRGLLLADRSEIDQETKTEFINSGVIHVLVVAGLHVGFIAIVFLFLFGRLGVYSKSILTIAGLFFFLILTGTQVPVFRAVIMASVLLIARITNRDTNGFNAISLAALIILLTDTNELFNPGFQLSFAAVFSILALNPFFTKWINNLNIKSKTIKWLLLAFGVTLSAQIGTLPITSIYFGKLSLVALLVNLAVIPITAMVMCNGIITLVFSVFSTYIASVFASTGDLLTRILFSLVKISGTLKFSFMRVSSFNLLDAIIFYVLILFFFALIRNFQNRTAKVFLLIVVTANIFLYTSLFDKELLPEGKLSVLMVDVGQGDSFLIKFPDGKTALMDAGNVSLNYDYGERVLLPLFNYLSIDKIDYGIVSHMDRDHFGGFISLVENSRVKSIIKTFPDTTSRKEIKFEEFLNRFGVAVIHPNDTILAVGNSRIYILKKYVNAEDNKPTMNNRSMVLKVLYGDISFLFTGDSEVKREYKLISIYDGFLKSDVLKVSHHGSKYCSSEEFLNTVKPKISLISVGFQNKFGHPSQEVLERLGRINSKIFRTDLQGAVLLVSNGYTINYIDYKNL